MLVRDAAPLGMLKAWVGLSSFLSSLACAANPMERAPARRVDEACCSSRPPLTYVSRQGRGENLHRGPRRSSPRSLTAHAATTCGRRPCTLELPSLEHAGYQAISAARTSAAHPSAPYFCLLLGPRRFRSGFYAPACLCQEAY